MNELTEAQQACLEAILINNPSGIDAIGQPLRDGDLITIEYQAGWMHMMAKIDVSKNTIETSLLNPENNPQIN